MFTQTQGLDRTDELMFDFAAGHVPEPVAVAMASLVEMSPAAARTYGKLNAVGGALLEDIVPEAMADNALDNIWSRLGPVAPVVTSGPQFASSRVPAPLQAYVGSCLDSLRWRRLVNGVEEYVIPTSSRDYRTSLLRIAPNRAMPEHTHLGEELTLVLEGGYTDGGRGYGRGDLQVADESLLHRPVADPEGCICLAVLSAPLQLSGFMGWLVNPFLRH